MKWRLKEFTFDDIRQDIVWDSLLFWGSYVTVMASPLTILNVVLSEYAHYNPYC